MAAYPTLSRIDISSPPGAELLARASRIASPEVIDIVNRLTRLFAVHSPFAPGFCCIGGEVALGGDNTGYASLMSVTGNGENFETALVSCLAEAADFLSQVERPGDVEVAGPRASIEASVADGWIAEIFTNIDHPVDWIRAKSAAAGTNVLLPADICLRRALARQQIIPPAPLSSGAAAGPDVASAALRAVLELCERDAVTLWWRGGRRPRGFPLEHPANRAATALIERLRGPIRERRTWLLDITADLGIATVAAVSVEASGRGLACGFAARLDEADAACAAVLELCQMEMSAPVADIKRKEMGENALNDADRRHLRRADFSTIDCDLLAPAVGIDLDPYEPPGNLDDLIDRLMRQGIPLYLMDMTRADVKVPTVRAVSPALQPFTDTVLTDRLRRTREESGNAHLEVDGVSLM
ncbi:hypothetical protein B5V03_17075 [Bradyrhizobium betae]|uniref:YcaO domain-containing protein n=2 Tax=Bradyrhizobium betae TaxID=244734 RepID=A0A4Q1V563_9BRAD|nr:hypothetical protein B5V03_17075 [Bradyrhizobium betae]